VSTPDPSRVAVEQRYAELFEHTCSASASRRVRSADGVQSGIRAFQAAALARAVREILDRTADPVPA
jgi:hypothetical protein